MISTQPPLSVRPVVLASGPRRSICAASIALLCSLVPLRAQTITKANNTDPLFSGTSWVGGLAPSGGDVARWEATVAGAQSLSLGGDLSWFGLEIIDPGGPITLNAGNLLTLGAGGIDLSRATQNLTLANAIDLGATQTWTVAGGRTVTVSGPISGGGTGITKTGAGTVVLSGTNTYSGATSIRDGTLRLDFSAAGAPLVDIVSAASALQLGGGSLVVQGSATGTVSQTFASTTLSAGLSQITVNNGAGGTASLALGAISAPIGNLGSVLRLQGPATIDGNGNVAATGTITTTTAGAGGAALPFGNLGTFNTPGQVGGYATVGLYDFASTNLAGSGGAGAAPYTIVGGSQVNGFYNTAAPANATSSGNWDMIANTTLGSGEKRASTLRFNTPGANTLTVTSGSATLMTLNAILVTPNMGATNTTITTGTGNFIGGWQIIRATSPAGQQEGIIWQNNTLGFLNFNAALLDGRDAGDVNHLVKAGPGTYAPNLVAGPGYYTGQTFLLEGATLIGANKDLGNPGTGANLNLNGGALVANATLALDNSGANLRAVILGSHGGTLAATTGNTLTVPGVVSGIPGTGALVIGHGLVAGSGDGTANPTAIVGNGTVVLTGANTHTGGTVVNAATVNINGIFALGGANYGGLTLNQGTLRYAGTLASDADVTIGRGLKLGTGGGTVDTNGNGVSFSAGPTGTGGLTKAGNGVLTLNAAGSYLGGTIVNGGILQVTSAVGSATGTGSVTINAGGTFGGTGTVGGPVLVNTGGILEPGLGVGALTVPSLTLGLDALLKFEFNTSPANDLINVTAPNGLTIQGGKFSLLAAGTANPWNVAGTYSLFSYAGSIQGTGTSALSVQNPAAGYSYTFGSAGGMVTVTVTAAGLISNWLPSTGGSWGTAGNWSSGVPNQIGATANLGSTLLAPGTVTLDGARIVGAVTFDNANAYTVAAGSGGTLTLQTSTGAANLAALSGSHTVNVPVILNTATTAEIAAGSALAVNGQLSGSRILTKRGGGTLVLGAANSHSGTALEAGVLEIRHSNALGSTLQVTASATLKAGAAALSPATPVALGSGVTMTVDTQEHTLNVAGVISDTGGTGSVEKTGSGTLILSGANTYGGSTVVHAGMLSVADLQDGGVVSPLGQSSSAANNLVLEGSTLRYTGAGSATDRLFTIGAGGATLDAVGTGPVVFSGPGALALTGLNQTRTLVLAGTSEGNVLTPSLGNNGTGSTTLVKNGGGTWMLAGANTFSGTTSVFGGKLALGHPQALQNSALDYSDQGGSISFVGINGATLGGIFGVQNLDLQNDTAGAVALTVGGNLLPATYSGVLSGPGSLTKIGNATLVLGGANTYTGSTTITAGNIRAAVTNALPPASQTFINIGGGLLLSHDVTVSSPITAAASSGEFVDVPDPGASATLASSVAVASGSHQYRLGISGSGATLTVTGAHTVGGAGSISFITRGNIVFAGNGSLSINTANDTFQFGRFSGQAMNLLVKDNASIVSGAMGFGGGQAGGPVTVTLQDNGSITAALGKTFDFHGVNANVSTTINLNGGTLTAGAFSKFQTSAGRETFLNLNGGTLRAGASNPNFLPELLGLFANVQGGGVKVDTAGFDVTIAQPLQHDANLGVAADGGLHKLGEGTLTLAGLESYTGATTVGTGGLMITGLISGSTVTTGAGTVLGGTGSLLDAQVAGTLAPGLPGIPGQLTAEGLVQFGAGSSFALQLSGLSAGTEHDQLVLGLIGGLAISGGSNASLTLNFAPAFGHAFVVVDNQSAAPISGVFGNLADEGVLMAEFNGNNYAFRADYQGGDGNDLVLTVVPEPSSMAFLCGGLGMMMLRRRRTFEIRNR